MRINNEIRQIINSSYADNNGYVLNLTIEDLFKGATVCLNNWAICEVADISEMIESLQAMKKAIENATGIIL